MEFKAVGFLMPGPSKDRPITLVLQAAKADEEGQRARVETDLSLDEAKDLASDLVAVTRWVESGIWKPRA